MDFERFKKFEEKIHSLSYTANLFFTQKFFEILFDNFYKNINHYSNSNFFRLIVDDYIIPSFTYYNLDKTKETELKNKKDRLIDLFIRPDHWNDYEFMDWKFGKGFKNIGNFILSYVDHIFKMASKENVYYLKKMRNQLLEGKLNEVSIFCEILCERFQFQTQFERITIQELNEYNSYDKNYGNFISYLIKNLN